MTLPMQRLGPHTRAWCARLRQRMDDDWDNMIGIQGERGVGKSTYALHLALEIDPGFNVGNVFYQAADWKKVIGDGKRQVFVLDEGTNIAFNRTWQNKNQVELVKLLNIVRQQNHTLIWCAPNLERMDVVVRQDIITSRVKIPERGRAIVSERKQGSLHGVRGAGEPYWRVVLVSRFGSLRNHELWGDYVALKAAAFQDQLRHAQPPVAAEVPSG